METRESQMAQAVISLARQLTTLQLANAQATADAGKRLQDLPRVTLQGTVTQRIDGVRHVATIRLEQKEF